MLLSDGPEKLICAVKGWWKEPYFEATCPTHGTIQVVRVQFEVDRVDVCPLCRSKVDSQVIEPSAEQRGRT